MCNRNIRLFGLIWLKPDSFIHIVGPFHIICLLYLRGPPHIIKIPVVPSGVHAMPLAAGINEGGHYFRYFGPSGAVQTVSDSRRPLF